MSFRLGRYIGNVGRALSQLGNALFLGRSPQATISGEIGRAVEKKGVGPAIAREVDSLLDKIDPHHSEKTAAYEARLLKEGKRVPGATEG